MLTLIDSVSSEAGDCQKFTFQDGEYVHEVSSIRKGDGKDIVCVPTQTGCRMGCTFCHLTPSRGAANLTEDDIVELTEQALKLDRPANRTLLVSYMGAGEPLLNVDGVIGSALRLRELPYEEVRFAVASILPGRAFDGFLADVLKYSLPFKLHLSLHTLDNDRRRSLMPSASKVINALYWLQLWTLEGLPAEIHYTPMEGVNDRPEDVDQFGWLVPKSIPIKLLRFAEKASQPDLLGSTRVEAFRDELVQAGFTVELYTPPGRDIGASCGQFLPR